LKTQIDGRQKKITVNPDGKNGDVRWHILNGGTVIKSGVNASGLFEIDCSDLNAWSPENPYLYHLSIDSEAPKRFGLLNITATQNHIHINGDHYYIRGYIRGLKAHEHDNFSFTNLRDFYEKNVKAAKSFGFNYVRWHSTIPDEDFLNVADELGLLCHVEFGFQPIWEKDENGRNVLTRVEFDKEAIKDAVERLSSHPCVAVYCLGNEIHNAAGRPEIREMVDLVRSLDSTRLIMDNCGWGEYDRDTSDFYCQHMGYFFPFGVHYNMFDVVDCFSINGSACGPLQTQGAGKFAETINIARPVIAHEALHYISWPDVEKLNRDFSDARTNALGKPKPWWVDETDKLEKLKGIQGDRKDRIMNASQNFFGLCIKHSIEQIRKSAFLRGFMMLQFADTHHYENHNGLVDCFDNPKFINASEFKRINDDVVLLLDMPVRCFASGKEQEFRFLVSNYAPEASFTHGDLDIILKSKDAIVQTLSCKDLKLRCRGVYELGRYSITLPICADPRKLIIESRLVTDNGQVYQNSWNIWCFPETKAMADDGTIIATQIDDDLLAKLEAGARVLCLYNPLATGEKQGCLQFPYVKDHFKPVIWDRGHQMGAVIRDSKATEAFPHDGWADFQFARLIEGAVKVNLDDFPVNIDPIIEGIDRPVRDRMSVIMGTSTEFNPTEYMRKFGYLFEMKVGAGRLLVCTFNFSDHHVETEYLLSALLAYMKNPSDTATEISADQLKSFLRPEGRLAEPPMNVYWEGDDEPVETKLFWEEIGVDITKF
jgi:hypothetical protein